MSRPPTNKAKMVTPTTTARRRWPSSQYPAPGTSQEARATTGTGAFCEELAAIRGRYCIRVGRRGKRKAQGSKARREGRAEISDSRLSRSPRLVLRDIRDDAI